MKLTVVMPFYRKVEHLRRSLVYNANYLSKNDVDVVLCVDDPSGYDYVVDLVKLYSNIKWTVILNRNEHEWRLPSKAINVGIKASTGAYVLIVSPESIFVGDIPFMLLNQASSGSCAAVGHVVFGTYKTLDEMNLNDAFMKHQAIQRVFTPFNWTLYYGSLCVERRALSLVGGYDESLIKWGGDDDNLRARLGLAGIPTACCSNAGIYHADFDERQFMKHKSNKTKEELNAILRPESAIANENGWGEDFNEVIYRNH